MPHPTFEAATKKHASVIIHWNGQDYVYVPVRYEEKGLLIREDGYGDIVEWYDHVEPSKHQVNGILENYVPKYKPDTTARLLKRGYASYDHYVPYHFTSTKPDIFLLWSLVCILGGMKALDVPIREYGESLLGSLIDTKVYMIIKMGTSYYVSVDTNDYERVKNAPIVAYFQAAFAENDLKFTIDVFDPLWPLN